jgi:hypothetical protein
MVVVQSNVSLQLVVQPYTVSCILVNGWAALLLLRLAAVGVFAAGISGQDLRLLILTQEVGP